jgi:hypothetical protein
MILNYFFFNNINFKTIKSNIIIYNLIINNKYKMNKSLFLNYPRASKYNWCTNYSIGMKFLNLNFLNVIHLDNFKIKKESSLERINNIIFFKKKSTIFKKNSDFEYTILHKCNRTRDEFNVNPKLHVLSKTNIVKTIDYTYLNKNILKKNLEVKFNAYNKNSNTLGQKMIDFKRKINLVYNQNRILLRKFLKVKFKRQNTFNRYIKNLTKLSHVNFLYNFEYRLVNLLTRSSFFFNYNDCIWFLKNGLITLNGFPVSNPKKLLKPLEIVNIAYSNYYFFYYRYMLDNCISNLYKFNMKIWKINNRRVNKKSKVAENYPIWTYKYMYYKEDVPKFLEVDYISMTMVLLNYSFNKEYVDFYNIKFLNLYLNRLYNWKFII